MTAHWLMTDVDLIPSGVKKRSARNAAYRWPLALPPGPRREGERVLRRGIEHLRGRVVHADATLPERAEVLAELRQTRGVGEQMPDRDRAPGGCRLRQIRGDGIVEPDLALLRELHDRRSGELFGDRSQLEDGVGGHGCLELDARETITLELHELPVADDRKGKAGNLPPRHLSPDVIVDRIRRGRRRRRDRERHDDKRQQDVARRPDQPCIAPIAQSLSPMQPKPRRVLQYDIVLWFQWRRKIGFAKHFPQVYFRGPAHL
jgi:hypothetical protein